MTATPSPADDALTVRELYVLRGPNIWANFPVIEARVDLGPLAETASDEVPGFNDRLMAWLPTMIEHRCSVGTRGGFFERLRRGTYPAHILEHVTLELQSLAGTPVGYGKARATADVRVYRVVFRYEHEAIGRACLDAARRLLRAAYRGEGFEIEAEVGRLRALAGPLRPETGRAALLAAARERGIPAIALDPSKPIDQLGQGARRRRLHAGATEALGAVAQEVAPELEPTRTLLRNVGVPVPEGREVTGPDDALAAAAEVGPPLAVRPTAAALGPGVAFGLDGPEAVRRAFEAARARARHVVVERSGPGRLHHVLLAGGRAAVALSREADGRPRDATAEVHPELAARLAEAAGALGLGLAAFDLTAESLDRPLEARGGLVLRVDPRPDPTPFAEAGAGPLAAFASAIVGHLFPDGSGDGRIPLAAFAGGPERSGPARRLLAMLRASGLRAGHAGPGLVELGGRRLDLGRRLGAFEAARALLIHPDVEAAVVELGRLDALADGLGFDRCSVAVLTGLDDESTAGSWAFDEPEQARRAERCALDVLLPGAPAVVRGDDPRLLALLAEADAPAILYAADPDAPALAAHRDGGGRTVAARDGRAERREGPDPAGRPIPLPAGLDAEATAAALAAVAAAWALGLADEAIAAGLA